MENKQNIEEALLRFKKLRDYDYQPDIIKEEFPIVYRETEDDDEDLILGSELYEDEESDEDSINQELDSLEDNEPTEEEPLDGEEEMNTTDVPDEESFSDEEETELDSLEEPTEDDAVEIDITDLVNNTEELKQDSQDTNSKIENLVNMFSKLENQLQSMEKISTKIEKLEKEIQHRNPTPKEKLEMRSLDSYPYSMKLTDYWNDKTDELKSETDKEYVLTQDDIDSDYSEVSVKNTFDDLEENF